MKNIPFYKPSIDGSEYEFVEKTLSLKKPKMVESLEETFCEYLNSKYAISTNNGTAARHLALRAMELKRGDKILCSVNSFPAITEVTRHFDAEPILVDINEDDFNIDVERLENTLQTNANKKIRAVFVSHVAGQSADLKNINKVADKFNIKVLNDVSTSLGITFEEKKIGSLDSYVTCYQMNPQMSHTISSAGMLVTEDEEIAQKASMFKNHAMINDGWDKFGNLGYVYDIVDVGLNYNLDEISAAYALGQFKKIDLAIKRRQEIAKIYDKELTNCPHVSIPIKKREHIYTQYIIKIDKNRDNFARLLREKGIHTALHYIPIHLLSYYKNKYNYKINDFPVALQNYQQILSLPIYLALSDEEVYYICNQIKEIASTRV